MGLGGGIRLGGLGSGAVDDRTRVYVPPASLSGASEATDQMPVDLLTPPREEIS
jgi:hypothetical protein